MNPMFARWPVVILFVAVLSEGVAQETTGGIRRFAFGTPGSVTRDGFTKVTLDDLFTPEKGHGFESADGLRAFNRGGSKIELPGDAYTASVYGAYRATSDITSALVEGRRENTFLVTLPDGDYTVWLIACDAAWAPPLFEVWTNGRKELDVRIPRTRFVFMEPFQARASGGLLRSELKGRHGWIVSGLVIGQEGPELAGVVAQLKQDIFFLTEQELPKWKEAKYVPEHPPLKWTAAEREKGYVVFCTNYTEQIVPGYIPARSTIGRPLATFATPGEFEPATLCILSSKDLGATTVELSDFVGEEGPFRIPRDNVSIGVVRCWPQRQSSWGGDGEYRVVPEMIERPDSRNDHVQAGHVKQWWLTVDVPPDTPAGRYRMSLNVRPEKAPPIALEWRLLVLPFSLSRPADMHWGTWLDGFPPVGGLHAPPERGRNAAATVDQLAQADIADFRDHRFDLVLLNYYFGVKEDADGTFVYDLSTLPQDLDRLKPLGSSAPVVICFEYTCRNLEYGFAEPGKKHVPGTFSPKARKAIVGLVRHIRDEAQRLGWPKLYFFPIDEPGNNKTKNRYQFAENVLDFVHEVPGCQAVLTVTADCVRRLGDRVDVRIYAYGHYNRANVLREAKQGHPFWYYDNGMFYGHSTRASRDLAGFEFLRSGAEVATAWGFAATNANPHNDFDGGHKDWNVIFPGVDGPTPTIYWELCREGVDDCRYVTTLQEHIALAEQSGKVEAAQRAEKVLAPLLSADAPPIENPAAFGRYRWRIAREILNLLDDRALAAPLSFTAVADNPPAPERVGPNLVENASFELPAQKNGLPSGRFAIGYPQTREDPAGALRVTDEVAHSGRCSLKWNLRKVAEAGLESGGPRWMTVNVSLPTDTVKQLRGKRFKAGYWFRLGGGTTTPGLQVRQQLTDGPGGGFSYRGGIQDPAVWNHFETEGRFGNNLESMDIHTWCTVPEPSRAKESYFYMDDFSLEVIDDPPLTISTPLDEYYVGEPIPWTVHRTDAGGQVRVTLLASERLIGEQASSPETDTSSGSFQTTGIEPGVYTLQATSGTPPQAAQRQVIVTSSPFDW